MRGYLYGGNYNTFIFENQAKVSSPACWSLLSLIRQIKKYFHLSSSGAQWAECIAKVFARDSGLETKDLSTGRAIGGV